MERVNKTIARKLFNEGKQFWMTACNMRPECGILVNAPVYKEEQTDFDKLVNAFTYYNCGNETGRYPAYYVE